MGRDGILRAVFAGALVAGTTYFLAEVLIVAALHFLPNSQAVYGPLWIVWKGTGVALLAIWCALQARSLDGWLIAAVMAFGALGDVLIEAVGLTAGAAAFIVGHVVAIWLYARNRRDAPTIPQRLLATVLFVATPVIAGLFVQQVEATLYAAFLGLMAASAWISRFPRYRVGLGAVMFVASDLLIFAKLGPLAGSPLPGLLIWPLYFGGQVLIAWGVVRTFARDCAGSR